MTLFNVVRSLEEIAMRLPSVRSAYDGSIYDIMNSSNGNRFGVFIVTQNEHRTSQMFDYYSFILFYCDRLVGDMDDNRLEVQSHGKQALSNIIHTFCDENDIDVPDIHYVTWTQRFAETCAGTYATVTFEIPLDYLCAEEY